MNVEYINPFIQSTQRILVLTVKEDVKLCKIYVKHAPLIFEEVSTKIGIFGHFEGQVFFTMSLKAALGIASKMMMGAPVPALDDMAKSALSELSNMISGHVATEFSGKGILIDITPPTLIVGHDQVDVSVLGSTLICVPLAFEDGSVLEIDIYMKDH